MATTTLPPVTRSFDSGDKRSRTATKQRNPLEVAMSALASLKLTVVLFALGIFIVWIGTLAQTEADIWEVVRDYFRSWIMLVDLGLLFPPSFFPGLHQNHPGFFQFLDRVPVPFPGGMTVGVLMAVNLIAAHTWRFKVQATGARLWGGLAVIGVGIFLTVLVILGGHNSEGFQAVPWFSWNSLWYGFLATVGAAWLGGIGGVAVWLKKTAAVLTRRQWVVLSVISAVLLIVPIVLAYALTAETTLGPESLRILWQLLQGTITGAVLLGGCVMVFRKRAGVVLLHGGIGLMMIGELFVSRYAVEAQVFLGEGHTTNYVRDIRTVELAIIDPSGKETDDVVVIPRAILERNAKENQRLAKQDKPPVFLSEDALPFKLAVLEYHKNADVRDTKKDEVTPATKGRGLKEAIVPKAPAKGTDTNNNVDMAAAYVRLQDKKGNDLGTYMLSQIASEQPNPSKFAEKVEVGGKTYDLFVRFRRDYKPYQITLKDVRKDDYLGTDTPMNYSSDVQVIDASRGTDREVKIWMNNPLRYAGETFYQSGYHKLPDGEYTTLAVVKNTGWMIPYVACMLVAVGMCAHFLITLSRFLNREDDVEIGKVNPYQTPIVVTAPAKKGKKKSGDRRADGQVQPLVGTRSGFGWESLGLPLLAVGLFAIIVGYYARPPKVEPREPNYVAFGQLPIVADGRVKPIDTLARNILRAISDRETINYKVDDTRIKASATEWLLDVATGNEKAYTYRIFRIDSPEVQQLFGLEHRSGGRYSVEELRDKFAAFEKEADAARKLAPDKLSVYQRRLLELEERLKSFMTLTEAFAPPRLPPLPTEEAHKADPKAASKWVQEFMLAASERMSRLEKMKAPLAIPLADKKVDAKNRWQAYPNAWAMAYMSGKLTNQKPDEPTLAFDTMLSTYREGDVPAFNAAVAKYDAVLHQTKPSDWDETKTSFEAYFNHFSPFYVGLPLYLIAFLLALFGFMFRWRPLNTAAFTLLLLTFALHTFALVARIYISGRPPVTNLYSSAVFIGWAAVLFGLIIEAIFRMGLGSLVAAVIGYATLQIAYFLSAGGDTIAVLQAVLDTQFWLATHVVCITLGYAATFFAGAFGLMYVIFGVMTPVLDVNLRKTLTRIIYGTVCFAIFFSFVGTVLGGLWADDSWGRFWGWDPKENGALIIVLWNALVLHARWGKMVGDRGLALLSIGGNVVTAWSWFGVNELGIGLHSYGFTDGVLLALGTFVLSQLVLIGIGLLPTRLWWSYSAERAGEPAVS
jgi:ABC-type transport system involved in cytochrome c biogenesis permease subunit